MRAGVEQAPPSVGNPDALLIVFDALEIDVGERRWSGDPGGSNGNEIRPGVMTPCGPVQRSRRHSTRIPGRIVGR